jgi:hypothetical protein
LDHIIRIVSMVAQMAASAMTGLTKRICDITLPPDGAAGARSRVREYGATARPPADPAEQYAAYPEGPTCKRPSSDNPVLKTTDRRGAREQLPAQRLQAVARKQLPASSCPQAVARKQLPASSCPQAAPASSARKQRPQAAPESSAASKCSSAVLASQASRSPSLARQRPSRLD